MKPIVVFTNFWDANILVQDQCFTFSELKSAEETKHYLIWLKDFTVSSIALSIPDESKIPHLKNIFRINHFCPTYDILTDYKESKDWDAYKKKYRNLLVSRKEDIDDWIKNLQQDKVYILCCWENTSKNCNCHRQLLFDAMRSTKIWKNEAIWVYRHGSGKYLRSYPKLISKNIGDKLSPENINYISLGTLAEVVAGISHETFENPNLDTLIFGDVSNVSISVNQNNQNNQPIF